MMNIQHLITLLSSALMGAALMLHTSKPQTAHHLAADALDQFRKSGLI